MDRVWREIEGPCRAPHWLREARRFVYREAGHFACRGFLPHLRDPRLRLFPDGEVRFVLSPYYTTVPAHD